MKIDSSSFNLITYSSFNSISTIFSDFSNLHHCCCQILFYGKFYFTIYFHGLNSILNIHNIKYDLDWSFPMANLLKTLFLRNHSHIIRSITQSECFSIHATFKIHKPFYQFKPSDSVNESSTYPDSQASLSKLQ